MNTQPSRLARGSLRLAVASVCLLALAGCAANDAYVQPAYAIQNGVAGPYPGAYYTEGGATYPDANEVYVSEGWPSAYGWGGGYWPGGYGSTLSFGMGFGPGFDFAGAWGFPGWGWGPAFGFGAWPGFGFGYGLGFGGWGYPGWGWAPWYGYAGYPIIDCGWQHCDRHHHHHRKPGDAGARPFNPHAVRHVDGSVYRHPGLPPLMIETAAARPSGRFPALRSAHFAPHHLRPAGSLQTPPASVEPQHFATRGERGTPMAAFHSLRGYPVSRATAMPATARARAFPMPRAQGFAARSAPPRHMSMPAPAHFSAPVQFPVPVQMADDRHAPHHH